MKTIYKALTLCGNHVEVMDYPNGVKCGKKNKIQPVKGKRKQNKIRFSSISRTKQKLRRLVWCNEEYLKTFVTLTFREDITDLKIANKKFHTFIKRLTYRFPGFLYLGVPEFQKKGRVHYHILTSISYIANEYLANIWTNGFVTIKALDKIDNMAHYLTKYLSKSSESDDERFFNKKKIFYSNNIHKPEIIKNPKEISGYIEYFGSALKPICSVNVEMDFVGQAVYSLYEIKSDHVFKETTKEEFDELMKMLLKNN